MRTSSFCSAGHCVGIRFEDDGVHVADTKAPASTLFFDYDEWTAFVAGIKNGEFDVPPASLSGVA